jgi:hypothetical protein
MVVDKDAVTRALRARGDHDRALQAETTLPRTVDLERDGALLQHQLDLTVSDVEAAAAGDDEESAPSA